MKATGRVTTFILASLLVFQFNAAWADIDVTANPNASSLHLKAHKKSKHHVPDSGGVAAKKPKAVTDCDSQEALDLGHCTAAGFNYTGSLKGAASEALVQAVREIGLPSLKINIQPGATTLVNLDTIFYARPQPFTKSVNLLDYAIDLTATPVSFTWRHGDGTSHTTQTAGAPYPSTAVTYRYQKPAKRLHPSVDVTYRVRYRIDGGAWQTLTQTLRASGPTSNLQVKEAGAVLARN